MSDVEARLTKNQAEFPFPEAEAARTARRSWITKWARKGGIGAEIGVFRGHFAEAIIAALAPKKFYLVDMWEMQGDSFGWSDAYTCNDTLTPEYARHETELRMSRHPRVEIVMLTARFPDCAAAFAEKLDWIYMDTTHEYEDTLAELRAAAGLLKDDGVIMGDDWVPDVDHYHHGVFRAVNEFIRTGPFEVVAAGPEAQWCVRRRSRYAGAP